MAWWSRKKRIAEKGSPRLTIEGASMNLDFTSDINKEYAAAMNYGGVDRFMVAILWWHFGASPAYIYELLFEIGFLFSFSLCLARYCLREALGAILVDGRLL